MPRYQTTTLPSPQDSISPMDSNQLGTVLVTFSAASVDATPGANITIYVPLLIHRPVIAYQLWVRLGGATAGLVGMGIWDETGTRLISTAQTPVGSFNTMQYFDITDTALTRGTYFVGVWNGTSTNRWNSFSTNGTAQLRSLGLYQQTGPMPSPAVFSVVSSITSVPNCGILARPTR